MTEGVMLITDSYKNAVNGISVFSHFFIEDVLQKEFSFIVVYETSSGKIFNINRDKIVHPAITKIYVNANFSRADFTIRRSSFQDMCRNLGIELKEGYKKIMISHGWTKIKLRYNYYSIYYCIKNFFRSADLKRLFFYDEIVFISHVNDNFRHKDHLFCVENNLPVSYYDFSGAFIRKLNISFTGAAHHENLPGYILVIANYQKVKNVWWMVRYNISRSLSRKGKKSFVLLVHPVKGLSFKVFTFFASIAGIKLIHEQVRKSNLLNKADYLFIPSFSEYNPVVALEAAACNKKVVSLYRISALEGERYYHYLIK